MAMKLNKIVKIMRLLVIFRLFNFEAWKRYSKSSTIDMATPKTTSK